MIAKKYISLGFHLLLLVTALPLGAQWHSLGDSIVPRDHLVKSLKIAPDRSIWATSNHWARPVSHIPVILRSANEGKDWRKPPLPVSNPVFGFDVSPLDSLTAFASAGKEGLFKTTNGGRDWVKVESYPYDAVLVHFFNHREGWVLSGDNYFLSVQNRMIHSLTKDGGKSWIHLGGENWEAPPGTSLPPGDTTEKIGCRYSISGGYDHTDHAIIIGMQSGHYWLSNDRGYNWTRHETPFVKLGRNISNVAMKDTRTFMVAGNHDNQLDNPTFTLSFATRDGGKTWLEGNPEVTANSTHYVPGSDSIFIMISHNDHYWGPFKGTAITYDFGANWKSIDNSRITCLDFLDKNYAFASHGSTPGWTTTVGQVFKWDYKLPAPPVKKTYWFIWMIPVVILSAGYIFHRYRLEQVKYETKMSLQLSELERAALQAQMNPHFIFNALNSLQSFINNNETENSNIFLSHFAQLIRGTLKASGSQKISLENEIELLKSYMELEKMRFENRFDYAFSLDEKIDKKTTMIPSMITQPFVENAIIHGLSKLKKKGMIKVDYRKEDNYLVVTIMDNGQGINQTRKNKKSLHKSVGMSNILKRLKLMNAENEMQVRELTEANGDVSGTEIVLKIAL